MNTKDLAPRHRLSGIILAGGRSNRMGCDKALLIWEGRPLIQHLVAQLKKFSDDVLVVTGPEVRYRELLDVPVFADEVKDCGPMGGLYTGLKRARHEYSLVVACDMPQLNLALVKALMGELDNSTLVVVPEVQGLRVPTLAIYHKECLKTLEQLLAAGRTSLQVVLDSVPTRIVSEGRLRHVDPTLRSFTNLNHPKDWASFTNQAKLR